MEIVESVPDGDGLEAWRRLRHASDLRLLGQCAGILLDIMNHVFLEGDPLQSAFEVFEKMCRMYRALSDEAASRKLRHEELCLRTLTR